MVAGTTATRTARTSTPRLSKPAPSKTAYKPRIQFVSANEYALPSESYGGHILYLVTVLGPNLAICECTGYTYRKTCKHCVLALAAHAYRAHPTHLRPATQEVAASVAPAPAFIPAPPAFSELFAA